MTTKISVKNQSILSLPHSSHHSIMKPSIKTKNEVSMNSTIIHMFIYFVFYIIGAYATTDILRLLKGSTTSINTPDCYCPVCHHKIALQDQIPFFSYLKNHGACHNCKSPIPVSDLFLEIFLFLLLSGTAFLLDFRWSACLLCILLYEMTKAVFMLLYGRRQDAFFSNLLLSLLNNAVIFSMVAFLFQLEHLV